MTRINWKDFEKTAILGNGAELILIEAENLSTQDKFMKYRPRTIKEIHAKHLILRAIEEKVKNFYRPVRDPSFDNDKIRFVSGKNPAVGMSYDYWADAAKNYAPDLNSRLGTRSEYGAFLGVLIKQLVKSGKSVRSAWNMVCNDSKNLGHYHNSKNGFHGSEFTGSRCVFVFYDLANVYKILAKDTEDGKFYLASGSYEGPSYYYPISTVRSDHYKTCDAKLNAVGWMVFSEE